MVNATNSAVTLIRVRYLFYRLHAFVSLARKPVPMASYVIGPSGTPRPSVINRIRIYSSGAMLGFLQRRPQVMPKLFALSLLTEVRTTVTETSKSLPLHWMAKFTFTRLDSQTISEFQTNTNRIQKYQAVSLLATAENDVVKPYRCMWKLTCFSVQKFKK